MQSQQKCPQYPAHLYTLGTCQWHWRKRKREDFFHSLFSGLPFWVLELSASLFRLASLLFWVAFHLAPELLGFPTTSVLTAKPQVGTRFLLLTASDGGPEAIFFFFFASLGFLFTHHGSAWISLSLFLLGLVTDFQTVHFFPEACKQLLKKFRFILSNVRSDWACFVNLFEAQSGFHFNLNGSWPA